MARFSIIINFPYAFIVLVSVYQIKTTSINDKNPLTFQWYDDVVPEKVNIAAADKNPHHAKYLAKYSRLYKTIRGVAIIESTNFTSEFSDSISWTASAGFVETVVHSYQKHHNLIIRPDDIWAAIIVQFSLYVNANAEQLRYKFVKFEKKKELKLKFTAPINQVPIDEFVNKTVSLIDENIDPKILPWILPIFSTTTKSDYITAGVALMATLRNYFDFSLMSVLCGIPKVTILGTVDDWKEIRRRIEKLQDFEVEGKDVMAKWSTMLGRILDHFVSVKEGNQRDGVFWKQAIRVDYEILDMGCAQQNETYLSGWITIFSAFDRSGRWQGNKNYRETENVTELDTQWLRIRTSQITPGIVQVPIKIYDEYAAEEERHYTAAIITGHIGYTVKTDERTIQPMSGWTMAITNYLPEHLHQSRK